MQLLNIKKDRVRVWLESCVPIFRVPIFIFLGAPLGLCSLLGHTSHSGLPKRGCQGDQRITEPWKSLLGCHLAAPNPLSGFSKCLQFKECWIGHSLSRAVNNRSLNFILPCSKQQNNFRWTVQFQVWNTTSKGTLHFWQDWGWVRTHTCNFY